MTTKYASNDTHLLPRVLSYLSQINVSQWTESVYQQTQPILLQTKNISLTLLGHCSRALTPLTPDLAYYCEPETIQAMEERLWDTWLQFREEPSITCSMHRTGSIAIVVGGFVVTRQLMASSAWSALSPLALLGSPIVKTGEAVALMSYGDTMLDRASKETHSPSSLWHLLEETLPVIQMITCLGVEHNHHRGVSYPLTWVACGISTLEVYGAMKLLSPVLDTWEWTIGEEAGMSA